MKGKKLTITKAVLEDLYLKQNHTPSKIGELLHTSNGTVLHWLHNYDIPIKRPYTSNVKVGFSSIEAAYFAGYLDGDGTINIGMGKNKKSRRGLNLHFDVSLISKNEAFIKKLNELIGGTINSSVYHDSRGKKNAYRLMFSNQRSALAFLEEIEPYLILKQTQARLMIEFLKERIEARIQKGTCAVISERCWEITEEIKRLNHI